MKNDDFNKNSQTSNEFKKLNSKKSKKVIDLPKRTSKLTDTTLIKMDDVLALLDKEEKEKKEPNKPLYDTTIIKLDDIISNRKSLKIFQTLKVTNVEKIPKHLKKLHLLKAHDITKDKIEDIRINVLSEEFQRQKLNLSRVALNRLSNIKNTKIRKPNITKVNKIKNVEVNKNKYLMYQDKIKKFAINKLYYRFAPKESKKYKIYKYSVLLSSFIFVLTSVVIINWVIQGVHTNNLSNSLKDDIPVTEVKDGELVNLPVKEVKPNEESKNEEETLKENNKKNSLYWKYLNTPLSSVDFTNLLKENKDTIGWIIVNNTNINYPVVQTTNNDYYLKHSFNRRSNLAGWVYADFRNDFQNFSKNTIIYAHGRKDKVMFGSLVNSLKPEWHKNKDNQLIQFSTLNYNTMWQIISIYKIKAESYYITTDFSSDESYQKFIDTMLSRSIYDFKVPVNVDDKLLTLSTCFNDNGIRLVVQAKLVKIQKR